MLRLLSLFLVGLTGPLSAFVAPVSLGEKCSRADGIVRGVVVDIVPVTRPTEDSSGLGAEKTTDREFTGPNAIAVVRVVEVLKGSPTVIRGTILVPCGYDFDESPSELTETKDYLLFLRSMGHGYFHPLDPFSTHRIQLGRISQSGIDSDADFEGNNEGKAPLPYGEFAAQVRELLNKAKEE